MKGRSFKVEVKCKGSKDIPKVLPTLLHWVQPQNHMHIHPTKNMMGKLLDSKIY